MVASKETFSIRFFMGNCKPENVTWPRSYGRACSLRVHVWTEGRASSRQWLATKNCTASRLKARSSFIYPPTTNHSCVLGNNSDALRLDEKQHGGLNNKGLPKIWNPGNLKLQTRNCKVQFAFCGFPWKIWCLRYLSNFRIVFCTNPGESCNYEQRRRWERHISRLTRRRRHYPQFATGNIELRGVQKESRWVAFFPISAELRHNCFLCVSRPYSYSGCILEIQVIT